MLGCFPLQQPFCQLFFFHILNRREHNNIRRHLLNRSKKWCARDTWKTGKQNWNLNPGFLKKSILSELNSMSSERNCTRTPYKAFYPRNSIEIESTLPVKFEAIPWFACNSIFQAALMAATRLTKQSNFEEKFLTTTTKNVNDDKL